MTDVTYGCQTCHDAGVVEYTRRREYSVFTPKWKWDKAEKHGAYWTEDQRVLFNFRSQYFEVRSLPVTFARKCPDCTDGRWTWLKDSA